MRKIFFKIIIVLGACVCLGNEDRAFCQSADKKPVVVEAAIPIFPATAVATAQEGQVLVVVGIRSDGTVKSVEFRSGPSIFIPALKLVASRWKFAPTNVRSEKRSVELSFIFRLVPTETKSEDMLPIYRPPYQVELRERRPIVSKDARFGRS